MFVYIYIYIYIYIYNIVVFLTFKRLLFKFVIWLTQRGCRTSKLVVTTSTITFILKLFILVSLFAYRSVSYSKQWLFLYTSFTDLFLYWKHAVLSVRNEIIFNVSNFRVQHRTIFRKFSRRSVTMQDRVRSWFIPREMCVFKVELRKVSSVPVSFFSFSVS